MRISAERGNGEMGSEVNEFKVILRFNKDKGVHSISPVKLTMILKNQ